ncbi:MAG TPA: hypothetical protein VJN43_21275 [Bryobacteraceae bacterium]|nr:hypothetical protein [Bryobacteraceae bacterium]
MKRALLFAMLALTLTGCAVRAGYYRGDGYWYHDHNRYDHHYRNSRHGDHDWDDRW